MLLANVIANGSPDFRTIFGLLESSLQAAGDDLGFFDGGIGILISTQIPKSVLFAYLFIIY